MMGVSIIFQMLSVLLIGETGIVGEKTITGHWQSIVFNTSYRGQE